MGDGSQGEIHKDTRKRRFNKNYVARSVAKLIADQFGRIPS